uniref:Sperm microtubule inner protein 1 C-terminal domain-containing protein n=1 Tax=Trichobilharzia regenti TaxID=157069 RepID=A0AA85KCU7_TRIRE|nr:unnamed protein product [Trichobilharzia regenti]
MARSFPADTRAQKALEELYEKETISQLNWFLKCQEAKKKLGSAPLTASAIIDAPLPSVSDILIKLKKPQQQQNKESEVSETKISAEITSAENGYDAEQINLTAEPDMRKPSEEILKFLYEGISQEGKGRYQYLHNRYQQNVEEKFQFPVLSSMEYGWGHADLISKMPSHAKKFGRQCVIEESFYRRTGIPIKHGSQMLGLDKYSF